MMFAKPLTTVDVRPLKSTNVRDARETPVRAASGSRAASTALATLASATYHAASWVAPTLTQRQMALRFFTPPKPRPLSKLGRAVLARADDRFRVRLADSSPFAFAWPGCGLPPPADPRVQVALWGRGPVVYLLHGWGGRAAQWAAWVDPLARAGYTAVVLDAPAHGDSPGNWTTIPQFAAALSTVVANVGPAHAVVGHSLGGAAVAFALRRGLEAARAVLLAAPAYPAAYFDAFAERAPLRGALRRSLREQAEHALGLPFDELAVRAPPGAATRALLVHDPDDRHVPHQDSLQIARAWPGAQRVPVTRLGHFGVLQSTEVIAHAIGFLENRSSAGGTG